MQLWLENATYYNLKEKSPNNIVCACSVAQSFLIVWDSMDCSPPGSSLFMGFPRQEYWNGLPFSSPGIFPTQGSNPCPLHWQVDSLPLSQQGSQDIMNSTTLSMFFPFLISLPKNTSCIIYFKTC